MPDDWMHVRSTGLAALVIYRRGAHVGYVPREENTAPKNKRGVIQNQSKASRQRAAFALGNAECEWSHTSLMTYPEGPLPPREKVKRDVDALRRKFRARWDEPIDAWVMEIQQRGAPHFHGFHASASNFGTALAVGRTEAHRRPDGSERIIVRGGAASWLRETWLAIIGETPAARRFCEGGMIEPLRSADAAGRYLAAEVGKMHQKDLPRCYAKGLGRWWWLAPRWKPRPRFVGTVDVESLPFDYPCPLIWDAEVSLRNADVDAHRIVIDPS